MTETKLTERRETHCVGKTDAVIIIIIIIIIQKALD
jgi:hypothetical protein